MKDVQSQKDRRGVGISEVGVSGIRLPIFFGAGRNRQLVVASVSMGVNLPADRKGTHMSRFLQIIQPYRDKTLDQGTMAKILNNMRKKLDAQQAKIGFDFTYFLSKKAPVSKKVSSSGYECQVEGKIGGNSESFYYTQVKVPVATLCPCSKEISRYGAHNQRAEVLLRVKSSEYIKPEEVITVIEKRASTELFPILKRPDEKYVTEKMYDNPRFVEDVAREIGVWAKADRRVQDYVIKCLSFESIHNHNAYAVIIKEK